MTVSRRAILLCIITALIALFTTGCGYRAGARSSTMLPNVRTIAVPTFENQTFRFKIEQTLTSAVIHEFLARTRYRVQSGIAGSDAVLNGIVTSIYSGPIVFDPSSGRTTKVLLTVGVRVSITDSKTGQPMFEPTDVMFREPYEVSTDPATYFAENAPALDRLSREVAASIVTTIIQSF
ncbi:MAG: LptE family protein [Acidobacteria bacterium]|nr:LptE family protein [Acidobacteriota bacterium]